VAAATGAALAFTAAWLLAPPMGVDLAAQVARGDFWARHGAAVLDFGWYGGVSPYAYSLVTPAAMAWLGAGVAGARALGAVAAVAASALLALLMVRTGARRPLAGGVLGAVGIIGNLVSGRVTFTAGLAVGLLTLLALTARRPWLRHAAAPVGGFLTGATSPVAGLFAGLAGAALLLARLRRGSGGPAGDGDGGPGRGSGGSAGDGDGRPGRWLDGLLVAAGAGLSIALMSILFGVNGPMNTLASDTLRAVTVSLLVAALVDRPALRAGALLSAAGVAAAAVLATPVGLNAGRLSATFALGVLAGYATVPRPVRLPAALYRPRPRAALLALLLAAVAVWQHPVAVLELRDAGNPMTSAARFGPLLAELSRRGPVGRVEVVPTGDYWEAAYVAAAVPLARGWLRQADTARNPVFFGGRLTATGYRRWLLDNGVSWVAAAPGPAAPVGRQEARLVGSGLPYLTPVWHAAGWTLYQVAGSPAVVVGATLLASTDGGVTLAARRAGDVLVRVRWSRWLAERGPAACVAPGPGGWTTLRVRAPGQYRVTGSLRPGPDC
jgi:hypothetical protein